MTIVCRSRGRVRMWAASLAVGLTAVSLAAESQQPTQAQVSAIRSNCRADYQKLCASVPPGGAASLSCLQQHVTQTSPGCQQALRAVSGASASTAPAATAGAAPAAPNPA